MATMFRFFWAVATGALGRRPGTVAVGSGPASVAVGDFNGDGRQDLAVANLGSDNVSILLGKWERDICGGDEVLP